MQIRPFRIAVDPHDVRDLHRRIEQTRWPSTITSAGWAQGVDAAFLRKLAAYWLTRYDWPRVQAALNEVPHFQAVVDTGSIHFVHLKGSGAGGLPIVLTHGWPSTFAELLQLGKMLAYPVTYGSAATDTFDVIIPSLPGYAFSAPPLKPGTDMFAIAEQWATLMRTLGYSRFLAHGGDLGAGVSTALGLRHGEQLLGVHLNYIPGSYRPYIASPAAPSAEETRYFEQRAAWLEQEGGYSHVQSTKPDTLGPALNDSPVGLAAWIVDKIRSWSDCNGDVESRFTLDELLTTISIYWFTQSMPSAIRLYWEGRRQPLQFGPTDRVNVPVAVAHFPRELPVPPRSYVERGYNVVRWTEMQQGGHFAAMEEPEALAEDIRAFARQFRAVTPAAGPAP